MNDQMIKKETGWIRVGDAMIPCDATINTDSTFDTPLIAKVGDTVFYLCMDFKIIDTLETSKVQMHIKKIAKGIVQKVDYATGCGVCLKIQREDGDEWMTGGVQELFFHSIEEATEVANKVNKYTQDHPEGEENWYEVYKTLFTPKYPYMLCFPVKPRKAWLVEEDGTCHIANRVIAVITEERQKIEYQGHDEKNYLGERKVIESLDSDWMEKDAYKIVPILPRNQEVIIVE